jgi:hypothetical protein
VNANTVSSADLLQTIVAATRRIVSVREAREPLADLARRAHARAPRPAAFSQALARTWIHSVRRVASAAAGEVYWLLLTSGYRTYRFLPVFFRAFYPRFDRETPASERALLEVLARERFGSQYDSAAGVVRFTCPQILADDLVVVPPGRTADAHVRHFLARNPGFVSGDELVCLTRIDDDNLTPAGRRMADIKRS